MLKVLNSFNFQSVNLPENYSDWYSLSITEKEYIYNTLAPKIVLLNTEYNAYRNYLAHIPSEQDLITTLFDALIFAEILENINKRHRDSLNHTREFQQFILDQNIYRNLLHLDLIPVFEVKNQLSLTNKPINQLHIDLNWPRLFFTRLRRLLIAIEIILKESKSKYWLRQVSAITNAFFRYISWLFFIPRLFTNTKLTLEHVIFGISEEEKNISRLIRCQVQWQRRWFEFFNDSAWLIGGLINCFVFIGLLATNAIYVGLALQVHDIVLSIVRLHVDITKIKKIENFYQTKLLELDVNSNDYAHVENYLKYLIERRRFDQNIRLIAILNNTVLLLPALSFLPFFAFMPIIPIIGASIAVLTTVVCFILTQYVEQKQRKLNNESTMLLKTSTLLSKQGMFKLTNGEEGNKDPGLPQTVCSKQKTEPRPLGSG